MQAERLLPPAVLGLLLAAGCSSSSPPALALPGFSGVTDQNLRWLRSADQDNRIVELEEVIDRLGPGRIITIESFDAMPLQPDWLRQPDMTWRIWEDGSGNFILASFDERDWLFRATGKLSSVPDSAP